ncbi:MAG: Rpn family recombination-promoting nuclease/putative transposase [Nostoc sp. NMS1]|uniref:Rpn family recombination-promoting nuclease/putative transposase n=1 Tax=unclassified Nostoc TaxID=2593658 RepID=UPI0025F0A3ED|nr:MULTISPECIES: Rpn family recombination-promoting nuclease/putative transposase [unclassified Nostoc]MBN3909123.1 Rpn family recombination-promoting nuclease/putative transposase [Nostoc sp. NMS1]MBN3990429.1 Rpn family recombination-promoting nuclease/putative transposase [Nostoc sp. NMS2]
MKTDSIFYRIFQSIPSTFFELINQPPQLASAYQFSSVEVKQLAFRIDGVFLPNTPDLPIYFAEVQFQPDKKFYSRLFTEIFNYLDKTELTNNWRGVVIFPNRSVDTGNTERYTELLNSQRVTRVYLDELSSIESSSIGIETVKLIIEPESTATTKAVEIVNIARRQIPDVTTIREIIQLIETILIYKLPRLSQEEIGKMFGLNELKQTRFYQDVFAEGEQKGKQEGRQEGKLEAIPQLLGLGLSIEQIAQALGLDEQVVRQAAQPKS